VNGGNAKNTDSRAEEGGGEEKVNVGKGTFFPGKENEQRGGTTFTVETNGGGGKRTTFRKNGDVPALVEKREGPEGGKGCLHKVLSKNKRSRPGFQDSLKGGKSTSSEKKKQNGYKRKGKPYQA